VLFRLPANSEYTRLRTTQIMSLSNYVPNLLQLVEYKFHRTDPLLHSVSRQLYVIVMKTVILVLLLVACSLVHSAPLDDGKSLLEYAKASV
jgi:hypothetical protein